MRKKTMLFLNVTIIILISINATTQPIIAPNTTTKPTEINQIDQQESTLKQQINTIITTLIEKMQWIQTIIQKITQHDILTSLINKIQTLFNIHGSPSVQSFNTLDIIPNLITITKTDHFTDYYIAEFGETFNYTITIKNPNTNPAQSQVVLIDQLPPEVTYISDNSETMNYTSTSHIIDGVFEDLLPGEKHIINITVQVRTDLNESSMINNTASVSSSSLEANTTYERTAIGQTNYDPLFVQIQNCPEQHIPPTPSNPVYLNYTINITNQNYHDVHNITIKNFLSDHVTFNKASQNVTLNQDNTIIYYGYDKIKSYSSTTAWINVTVKTNTIPLTIIDTLVQARCYETNDIGYDEKHTIIMENNPPTTTISIGDPHYQHDGRYYIADDTPITLTATDNLTYWTGVKNLTYQIWRNQQFLNQETIIDNSYEDTDPREGFINTTIYLLDSYNIDVIFYAYDEFNKEPIDSDNIIHFHEIQAVPYVDIIIEDPKIECYYNINGRCYDAISSQTPITVYATGIPSDNGYGELDYLHIDIYHGEQYGDWELEQQHIIYDNDQHDEDPEKNSIVYHIEINQNCWYQIDYWSVDKLGNTNPGNGQMKTKDLYSDSEGPESYHWFQGPQYHDPFHWITNNTNINIISMDSGCNGNGIGVEKLEWWLHKKINDNHWYETQRHIIYDNQQNDQDQTSKTIQTQLTIDPHGEYFLFHQSTDKLGNKGTIYKKHIKVDTHPPDTILSIDNPKCPYLQDEQEIYCITSNTQLSVHSYDKQHPNAVGLHYLEYKIIKNNNTQLHNTIYDYNYDYFTINDQGLHTLLYRAVDLLGQTEPWHEQHLMVDDVKPTISLTIKGYNITSTYTPDYWVKTNTTIIINGTNQAGGCPDWTMFFKINNESPQYITHPNQRPYQIQFPHECKYTLEIEAADCVGNKEIIKKQFYVDDSAPEFHIIKPHNGVYKNGDTIHATFYAKDESQYTPPCYEDHAIGIPHNSQGEAWIIDIYPTLHICQLENIDFNYDLTSFEYNGDLRIPNNCQIPDGSAYFIGGAKDALHNGKHHIRNMIENYYQTFGPDSTIFQDLIQTLLNTNQIKEIVIDSTNPDEPEPGAPSVKIIQPIHNQTLTQEIITIEINATDAETETKNLSVQIQIQIPEFHSYLIDTIYDETTQHFICTFDLSYIKNNSEIILQAYATDTNNKTGISTPIYCTIQNTVFYSKWLPIGWNDLQFPTFITNTSIHYVFSTIFESFYIIFEIETGDYYIKDQDFNTLETITPGNTYWVKMIQEDELYLKE